MKRLILTVSGTVAGFAALLSFKTQAHPITAAGPLPSAGARTDAPASSAALSSTRGTPTPTTSRSATPARTRTVSRNYVGRAITTRYGVVQVKVTVAASKITGVSFEQLTAFDRHSEEINSMAGPQLLQETLTQQSAQVDTISGASYTSDGYRQSLQSALDQAHLK
ncbi:FMN-binding protein [uncultured Jatrophihabitans sp.]|uniref:FMN-binding protein n=1 Tax=uncultured Jatrophihabitans sp. TaxID=1610747 RepID=UPI0035CB1F0A